jgi:hypothetical protein
VRPLLAVALLAFVSPAAPVPKGMKAKKDDATHIVGLWLSANPNTYSFRYNDDGTMKVWNGPQGEAGGVAYKWTLDATPSPKRMTWYSVGSTTPSFECVYEMDGDDLSITYESAPKVPTAVGGSGQNHKMTRSPEPATK